VSYDAPTRSLCASNRWNSDFADPVAFLTADREPHGLTADRSEFLGREGDPRAPAALGRVGLSGSVVAGLDPCAALQVHLDIAPGEEVRTHFVLGAGRDSDHASQLAQRWREPPAVAEASQKLAAHWDSLLSAVTIKTPELAMDLLINRWALYQALSSRILARTGFYQSSGAFGFRDQLQDVLALLHCDPARTRAHILECASRQFEEGDVLHWWHPPLGRGIRTRCSDAPSAVGLGNSEFISLRRLRTVVHPSASRGFRACLGRASRCISCAPAACSRAAPSGEGLLRRPAATDRWRPS
jgi:cyclic beta-1,2-glucan synthetase